SVCMRSALSLHDALPISGMNAVVARDGAEAVELDPAQVAALIAERDAQVDNAFSKDRQIQAIHAARGYLGDRIIRADAPHRLTDPAAESVVAVRLVVLTRNALGGLHTDLMGWVLRDGFSGAARGGRVIDGMFAAGEAAGVGGRCLLRHNALEGTFLGGCLFSGRVAGRS